ncbi:MAG: hypothetical protein U0941_11860 [Planctomycetaceae bacterium]
METTIALTSIVQAVTAVVIAIATIVYTRVTARIFEAGIEPSVAVDISGSAETNKLTIENDAGCAISEVTASISVGYSRREQVYPIRRCVYSREWGSIRGGESVATDTSPIMIDDILHGDDDLPDGVQVDPNDLLVDYSFVRSADRRRYCFRYRVGFLRQSDGSRFYTRIGEPEPVATLKSHIVRRVKGEQSHALEPAAGPDPNGNTSPSAQ